MQEHKAYFIKTGEDEWGKTYTVYTWDSVAMIYRELVTDVTYTTARRIVKESNV